MQKPNLLLIAAFLYVFIGINLNFFFYLWEISHIFTQIQAKVCLGFFRISKSLIDFFIPLNQCVNFRVDPFPHSPFCPVLLDALLRAAYKTSRIIFSDSDQSGMFDVLLI